MAGEFGTKKTSLSFGFSKKKDSSKLVQSAIKDEESKLPEEEAAFVDSFDGQQLNREEKNELVIPLITTNRWQKAFKPEDLEKEDDERKETDLKKVEGGTIESEAANELLREAAEREGALGDDEKKESTVTVPLLMVNKVPDGFESDERLDVSLRPEGSVAADYDQVPIEAYGFAMLRGMGWKEGIGIGKKGRLAKPVDAVLRPKGMGLGADRNLAKQKANEQETRDPEVDKLTHKKGVHCVVTNGRHKDLYGIIEGVDEDNSRVVVKMTLSRENITINQFAVRLVTKKDYDNNSKVLNKAKVDKYKEEESRKQERRDRDSRHSNGDKRKDDDRDRRRDRDSDRDRKSDRDNEKDRKRKHEDSASTSSKHKPPSQSKRMWLKPHLRVRIVDPEYKKGKYFKTKVIIEDVIGPGECICRTDEGRVLENVQQTMVETVIPRSDPAYVMVVGGQYQGKLGEVLRKDKGTGEAIIQLLEDRDTALTLSFDDICDYTGNIDHEFDF